MPIFTPSIWQALCALVIVEGIKRNQVVPTYQHSLSDVAQSRHLRLWWPECAIVTSADTATGNCLCISRLHATPLALARRCKPSRSCFSSWAFISPSRSPNRQFSECVGP
ncbi:hypothetical protein TRVL_08353 [Trypanosoma vivax]|nr:hypothetical protein TRVL_08353 [Trypanosoma vivax]